MKPEEFIREYETPSSSHGIEHTLRLIDENAVYCLCKGTHDSKVELRARTNGNG